MTKLPGFVGGSNQAQTSFVSSERTVNWYLETRDIGQPRSESWLYATPGLASWQSIGTGPYRGSFEQDGRAWVISGTDLREVFTDGTSTSRGTVAAGVDQGTIVSNGQGGNQLLIVVGSFGYVYNLTTNALTLIADTDFPQGSASMCDFLDGYGIVLVDGAPTFQISDLEDFTSWDALDIAQKSQTSDNLVAIKVDLDRKVMALYGSESIEYWWDSGAAAFPFEPVPNSLISLGCAAKDAVLHSSAGMLWVARNTDGGRMLYAAEGTSNTRVSSHAVETAWASYPTIDDLIAWQYTWKGHAFCVFTSQYGTWVFDATEKAWHEWLEWDSTIGEYVPHLGRTHMYVFNRHLVGSRVDGTIYELRADTATDNSQPVRRLRRSPHVFKDGGWVTCDRLRFDFQTGVGLTTGQGSNPQVMLKISRDGCRTFGVERWESLGAIGNVTRVEYRRNGRWRDGGLELTITDPVVTALTGAWGEFSPEEEAA